MEKQTKKSTRREMTPSEKSYQRLRRRRRFLRFLPLYIMLLPGAAYLIINNYLPMAGLLIG